MPYVSHTGLCVTDLARSARFYRELLGFQYCRSLEMGADQVTDFLDLEQPGNDMKAIYLELGDFQLELLQYVPAGPDRVRNRKMHETGLTHLSIAVDSVPAIIARLADYGGELVSRIEDNAAMLRDPDGQFIELVDSTFFSEERARKD